jgi:hypothetical protein
MDGFLAQVWDMHIGRLNGPLSFRLVIQPLVAAGVGIRAGLSDARAGRPPFGWTVITRSDLRRNLLLEKWSHLKGLFLVAVLIDVIYQIIVFRWIYPGQALIVAAILAFPSYFLIRGLTNKIARPWPRGPDLPPSQV